MKAIYHPKGNKDIELRNSTGKAWKAVGFNDYNSPEYQAWCFLPSGEQYAIYTSEEELEFVKEVNQ